jgi:hypothetical protein
LDTILKCTLDGEFTLVEHEGFRYHGGNDSWKVEDIVDDCATLREEADGQVKLAVLADVRRVLAWAGGLDMSFHGQLLQRFLRMESPWEYPDFLHQKLLALFGGKVEYETSPMPPRVLQSQVRSPSCQYFLQSHTLTAGDALMLNVGRFRQG